MDRTQVPSAELQHEKEVLTEQARNEGKPEKIIEKMVEGRIEKYYKEVYVGSNDAICFKASETTQRNVFTDFCDFFSNQSCNSLSMDCKKALTECDGDMDKAVDFLREKGLAQAAKCDPNKQDLQQLPA